MRRFAGACLRTAVLFLLATGAHLSGLLGRPADLGEAEIAYAVLKLASVPLALAVALAAFSPQTPSAGLLLQGGGQLCSSGCLAWGLLGWVAAEEQKSMGGMVVSVLVMALGALCCLEMSWRAMIYRRSNPTPTPAVSNCLGDAILVGLDFIFGKVGFADEPLEVRRLRSRGLFMLIAIPPAAWIAILIKVLGPDPVGSQQFVYLGPALLWVGAWFAWMVKTYGPSRQKSKASSNP